MQTTVDAVIIGAGVIGCSTAYHLARMGVTDVAVLEMGEVGSGSSSKSASMLSLQLRSDALSIRRSKLSYERYMRFEEEIGEPIDYRRIGCLSLATEESVESLRKSAELLRSQGVATDVLEPEEINRRYPEINTEDVVLGTWGSEDGPVDAHTIMWGYMKRAREKGVSLHQGVRATGVEVRNGRVEGVRTDKGLIASRLVVNAGGPWAIEIGRWVGVEIPIINLVRTILVTTPVSEIPSSRPFVENVTPEWYYRPEGEGVLIGMGTDPADRLEVEPSDEMIAEIIETATRRVPALANASLQTTWAGVRPTTPDGHPILGPTPSVEGFVLNCGWGGTGISQAPIAGQLIGEYISTGRASTMDIEGFGIRRFERKEA